MYVIALTVIRMMNQNKLSVTQMQVAKLSMRVIINHLNEALFLKSEDGHLSYANDLGTHIIAKTSDHLFNNN